MVDPFPAACAIRAVGHRHHCPEERLAGGLHPALSVARRAHDRIVAWLGTDAVTVVTPNIGIERDLAFKPECCLGQIEVEPGHTTLARGADQTIVAHLRGFDSDEVQIALQSGEGADGDVVTVAIDSMSFHSAVNIGDLVTVQSQVTWVGTSSIETRVIVRAENVIDGRTTHTNTGYFVYVALDDRGQPVEVPRLICETAEEKALCDAGSKRQARRLSRRDHDMPRMSQ